MFRKRYFILFMTVCLLTLCLCVPASALELSFQDGKLVVDAGEYPDLTGDIEDVQNQVSGKVIGKGQKILSLIVALCAFVCVGALIFNITKISTSGSHPIQKRAAMISLLWSLVGISFFGGGFVLIRFAWNFLK